MAIKLHMPNKHTIGHIAPLVLLVAVLGVLLIASVHGYDKHKTQTLKTQADAQAAQIAAQRAEQAKQAKVIAQWETVYQSARVNCEKGEAIYNALPITTKRTVKAESIPSCPPAVPFQ